MVFPCRRFAPQHTYATGIGSRETRRDLARDRPLAAENGLSASGLAKKSGLDPTTFNPSKRAMPDGRPRWPSTESVAKVLRATGASLEQFTSFVTGTKQVAATPPARPPSGSR